jgi:hypothetical protein
MKKYVLGLLLAFSMTSLFAQPWNTFASGIYYNSGIVVIGKTTGSFPLDVNGPANASYYMINGSPGWLINGTTLYSNYPNSLALGGGAQTALGKVHAQNNSTVTTYSSLSVPDIELHLENGSTTNNNFTVMQFADGSGTPLAHIGTINTNHTTHYGKLFFSTRPSGGSLTQRMTIDENGKVGIGNASPAYTLDVAGTINATALYVNGTPFVGGSQWTTSSSNIYFTTGNVGIGKTAPAYALDVNGTVNATALYVNGAPITGGSQWASSGSNISYTPGVVSIGTATAPAGYKLAVGGKVIGEEIVVKLQANWPDYVFNKRYPLLPLAELEKSIQAAGHLPEVPTAEQVSRDGLAVGEMNATLLKKVEELTLYLIDLNKKTDALSATVKAQREEIEQLKSQAAVRNK